MPRVAPQTALPDPKLFGCSWSYPAEGFTFNIYEATDPRGPFSFRTNVTTTNFYCPIEPGAHFFMVTALNPSNGLESDPATGAPYVAP